MGLKQHRGHDEAAHEHESAGPAPGKRAMTDALAPVQRQSNASAPVQLSMAAPAQQEDPFGLHLTAPVQRKETGDANAAEPKWVTRAREYHRDNPKYAEQFKKATNNACVGADGELDPNEIARWQVKHGLKPDGICGPDTASAAIAFAHGDERETPAPSAEKKVDENAPLPAPPAPKNDPTDTINAIKQVGGNVVDAAGSVWDNLIEIFTPAGGNAAGGNAAPKAPPPKAADGGNTPAPTPTPTPAPTQAPTDPAPKHAPVDQGEIGDLTDSTLRDIAMKSNDPLVKDIAGDLAGLSETFQKLHAKGKKGEEKGAARDKYVENIGDVRKKLASLKGEAAFKAAAYRLIASIGTYYSQSRNIDILESPPPGDTRTCNITSLSMALEGLGLSAAAFKGSHDKVQAAAKFYSHKITGDAVSGGAEDAVGGKGTSWGALAALRLSDFMELAAIARSMPDTSDEGVKAGAKEAWNSILSIYTLKELAGKFGASGDVKAFDATGIKRVKGNKKKGIAAVENDVDVLGDFGGDHRKDVEKYINAKNKGDAGEIAKYQAGYDAAMNDNSMEDRLSIEAYRDYVIEHIGADLAKGGSIVIGLSGHYAKLQAIVADGIIVNDPARDSRAATHLSWKEARAMGYFKHRLVLT